jgi:hypothetical protein
METLWGVKAQDGKLLPIIAHSEVDALKLAAEHVNGSQSQLSVGKLILAGYRSVEVELKEHTT